MLKNFIFFEISIKSKYFDVMIVIRIIFLDFQLLLGLLLLGMNGLNWV